MIKRFMEDLRSHPLILSVDQRFLAGIPFLYVQSIQTWQEISRLITQTADRLVMDTSLHYELIYVRTFKHNHVYRFRFLYPLAKSFCCGKQCGEDCVLRNPPQV
ncbi:hypothetical protein [Ammoniphilus sp. CFH 90114]|uniref:hypothetical protein n=1 Tax=Ammoniphilus sp. CFH 90114 TaxID=2493665 RepID=UPI00100F4ABE|nr:hypothetical protein [Ammoniphilus sp. CFH 90114]RXT13634.1 hypothetical protein EIZ39_05645 [Ammoniphilus sp. CFH 90114]